MKQNEGIHPSKPVPHDYKYRCLIEGTTDNPFLLAEARNIDAVLLLAQGLTTPEALRRIDETP